MPPITSRFWCVEIIAYINNKFNKKIYKKSSGRSNFFNPLYICIYIYNEDEDSVLKDLTKKLFKFITTLYKIH